LIKLTNGSVQDAGGVVQPLGYLVLQLNADATVIATPGTVVRARPITFRFDSSGNLSGSCQIYSNAELTPQTQYQVSFFDKNNSRLSDPQTWQFTQSSGATVDIGTMVAVTGGATYPQPIIQNPTAQQTINGQTLNMEGASVGFSAAGSTTADSFFSRLAAGVIAVGTAMGNAPGTLVLQSIKQAPTASNVAFVILDANGVSHFQISNSAPYINTFLSGNGAGNVFLGSAAKASVSDTTGQVVTAGGIVFQNTSQLLPATAANDATGGVTITTNGGKAVQWTNAGVLVVNPSALGRGAALTVGGTSATTGGVSIFVGALGSQTETLAVDPNDGASAPTRMAAISIRTLSAGFLSGTQNFGVTNAGVVTGASFGTGIAQGSGLKHQRFGGLCSTAAAAGATCITALTWTSAFADANYTVVCTGITQTNTPAGPSVESVTATGFTVRITAITAGAGTFAAVDCIAIHD
jgi:hypothetical protein